MKKVEATGKTIEQAIAEGLKMLDTTLDNVNVEIINDASLFKKARVQLTLIEQEEHEEQEALPQENVVEETVVQEIIDKPEEKLEKQKIKYTSSDIIMYVSKYLNHMIYLYNQIGEVEVKEEGKDFLAYILQFLSLWVVPLQTYN